MSDLRSHREGPVLRLTLDRPARRNAFDAAMIAGLHQAFTDAAQDMALRLIVLDATGPTFCAGADLHWMQTMAEQGHAANQADARRLADMLWAQAHCPVPVLSVVQGDCMGGGVGLVACSDIVLAARDSRFALSEARLGLAPATIGPYVMRAIGARAMLHLALTAQAIDATRAQALGLVHEVCEAQALAETADQWVRKLLRNGPAALRACKRLVSDLGQAAWTPELGEATARLIADLRASPEGREGMQAFLSRRDPHWVEAWPPHPTGEAPH